ncbi:SHOCT domain-containing protein [Cohnella silvisoli]|uniref:SHOCT domain-containing protein n=1 Tax=Cohnella silvisoli TaxID=2873699 RepID=A0ABV1KMU1_9BACL|nr:SHOCT domain-containing protein [Cohnella silvisoli]MCD9020410.1 SHOCT domain-containing protein [Cohnella silvisoli]
MWHHDHGFFPGFPIVFFTLLIGFLIFRIVMFRRYGSAWGYGYRVGAWKHAEGSLDAAVILKKRLASGEIDEAEYRRLLDIIKE